MKQECAFWLSVFKCPREADCITVSYLLDYTRDNLETSNLQWQRCAKAMCLAYPTELKPSLIDEVTFKCEKRITNVGFYIL